MPLLCILCIAAFALVSANGKQSGVDNSRDCNGGYDQDRVTSLPFLNTPKNRVPTKQFAGFVNVNASVDGNLFYWFTEAMNPVATGTDVPLVIWLNGGPGASSLNGLYFATGMYQLNDDLTMDVKPPSKTWNDKYHMLFWDQPIGSGYSYCNDDGYVTDNDQMGQEFVRAMAGFYDCHPEYAWNPLYITGQSYAGRYIPFIAKWMQKVGGFPLKGIAIGNGNYNPYIMYRYPVEYAYGVGVLDKEEYELIKPQVAYALDVVATYNQRLAADMVLKATNDIYEVYGGNIFQYDVRTTGDAFDRMATILNEYSNLASVQEALHTTGHPFTASDGTSETNPVFEALKHNIVQNDSAIVIPQLLDSGLPIMFYNGQFDGGRCNTIGFKAWLNQMNYNGLWLNAPKKPVHAQRNGPTIGYVKVLQKPKNLMTFFVVSNAGHLVPIDQPQNSKHMLETWIEGGFWN